MSLQTRRPDDHAISSLSYSQPYMKARCGLTFILSPTEKTSASTTDDSQEDFSESRPVSVPVRRASRHSFPKPLLSHTIKHYNSMSARSGSGGSTGHNDDDWKNIANEKERRKVQNRNAQRRHSMYLPLPSLQLDGLSTLSEKMSCIGHVVPTHPHSYFLLDLFCNIHSSIFPGSSFVPMESPADV